MLSLILVALSLLISKLPTYFPLRWTKDEEVFFSLSKRLAIAVIEETDTFMPTRY